MCLPNNKTDYAMPTTPPIKSALHLPLYVRIWLAVVLAVAVLTLLTGWIMRMTAEPPLREVLVRNAEGGVAYQVFFALVPMLARRPVLATGH